MRTAILKLIVAFAMIFVSADMYAVPENGQTILLKKEKKRKNHDTWDPEVEGHRLPSKPIQCVISPSGIEIEGVAISEIYLFEVYDACNDSSVSFSSESDFIDFVFSTDEELQVIFFTSDYILTGYL